MSGGANKKFRTKMRGDFLGTRDPLSYLRENLFASQPHVTLSALSAGRVLVNLVAESNTVSVRLAKSERSKDSNAFNAFWLPNDENKSAFVQLSDQADFLFTPALTGCTLEIDGTTVRHHDGNIDLPADVSNLRLGGAAGRRRWDRGSFYASVVIGVRRDGGWEFYRQSYQSGHTGQLPAAQVSAI